MPSNFGFDTPGRRLLPATIDHIARTDPHRAWGAIPISADLSQGYRDVSFKAFARAINRAAWFLETTYGRAEVSTTIGYIGKSDMRYHIFAMAAAKTGYQILYTSHINSLAAHLNLLEHCKCQFFMSANGVDVADILSARSMKHAICPELNELLDESSVKPYPMLKTYDEAADDVYLILHSSGTTGLPKPLCITHGMVGADDQMLHLGQGRECEDTETQGWCISDEAVGRMVSPFSPFHVVSSVVMMCFTVFGGTTYVFGPSERSLSPMDMLDAIESSHADSAFCAPVVMEKFASSADDMRRLGKLKRVFYGGGILLPRVGRILTEQVPQTKFQHVFGATETGMWALYRLGPEDMDYLSIDACHMGIDWQPVPTGDEDETSEKLFEPVMVRSKQLGASQVVFHVFPHLETYETGDLFAAHPTRAHTWKFVGRADDLIAFAHGVKYHPAGTEAAIQQSHEWIREVLMLGDRHYQAVLLVELTPKGLEAVKDTVAAAELREQMERAIDESNSTAPVIAQLTKTHIVFVTEEKPFSRTPKGSVKRRAAAELYRDEMEKTYLEYGDRMGAVMSRVK